MPTYEYACPACKHEWEFEQSIKDAALTECPSCHQATARRQISRGGGFILKGSGWYADLYSSPTNKGTEGKGAEGKGTEGKGTEGKGAEGKSADTKAEPAASPAASTSSESSGSSSGSSGDSSTTAKSGPSSPSS